MTKWMRFACLAVCVLCTLFCAVGYAAISGNLTISGQVELQMPDFDSVVILDVEVVNVDGVTTATSTASNILPTNVSSTITGSAGDKVVYKFTAKNFSEDTIYTFDETEWLVTGDVNAKLDTIGVYADSALSETFRGVPINPDETVTFYAVYTLKEDATDGTDTMVNYTFGLSANSDGFVIPTGATAKFSEILNNPQTYETLTGTVGIVWRGYAGNVSDSLNGLTGGTTIVNDLFTTTKTLEDGTTVEVNELTLEFIDENGEPQPVTVSTIIQQANIDGKDGEEMILYLTPYNIETLDLTSAGKISVYAIIYTNTSYVSEGDEYVPSGTWYQLGDMYDGAATVMRWSYAGNPNQYFPADAFNPNSWKSGTPTIENNIVTSQTDTTYTHANYQYEVKAGQSISDIASVNADGNLTGIIAALLEEAKKIQDANYVVDQDVLDALDKAIELATIISGIQDLSQLEAIAAIRELEAVLAPFGVTTVPIS